MRKNLFSTFFWLLFALYISIESYRLGLGKWNMPGPGYFPFGAGILLGIIGLWVLFNTLLKEPLGKTADLSTSTERVSWQNIVLSLAGMLVYVLLLHWIGFVLCTFFLMTFFVWVVGKRRWSVSLVVALSITVASYLLFEVLLEAHLPKGLLGILF